MIKQKGKNLILLNKKVENVMSLRAPSADVHFLCVNIISNTKIGFKFSSVYEVEVRIIQIIKYAP